jgi:hypothetical protein
MFGRILAVRVDEDVHLGQLRQLSAPAANGSALPGRARFSWASRRSSKGIVVRMMPIIPWPHHCGGGGEAHGIPAVWIARSLSLPASPAFLLHRLEEPGEADAR